MAKRQKMWVYSLPKEQPKEVSELLKQSVSEQADKLVENYLKPKWIKEMPEDYTFNYIVDIYTKWFRNRFYFCSKYKCPSPQALSPLFETMFARMTHRGGGKFDLAYFRHTGQWHEIFYDLTAEECLKEIKESGFFHP